VDMPVILKSYISCVSLLMIYNMAAKYQAER